MIKHSIHEGDIYTEETSRTGVLWSAKACNFISPTARCSVDIISLLHVNVFKCVERVITNVPYIMAGLLG